MTSYKPVVRTGSDPEFYGNSLRFATHEEALQSAEDLMRRWMLVVECGVQESEDPVNRKLFPDGEMYEVKA